MPMNWGFVASLQASARAENCPGSVRDAEVPGSNPGSPTHKSLLRSSAGVRRIRINRHIKDARRDAFAGIGPPEPLRHVLQDSSSRRIDGEHRLDELVERNAIIVLQTRCRDEPSSEERCSGRDGEASIAYRPPDLTGAVFQVPHPHSRFPRGEGSARAISPCLPRRCGWFHDGSILFGSPIMKIQ